MKIAIALILFIAIALLVAHLMRQSKSEPTSTSLEPDASSAELDVVDKSSNVPPSVSRHVVFTIPNQRQATCEGEAITLERL